jgi:hypothetical protein
VIVRHAGMGRRRSGGTSPRGSTCRSLSSIRSFTDRTGSRHRIRVARRLAGVPAFRSCGARDTHLVLFLQAPLDSLSRSGVSSGMAGLVSAPVVEAAHGLAQPALWAWTLASSCGRSSGEDRQDHDVAQTWGRNSGWTAWKRPFIQQPSSQPAEILKTAPR